MAKTMVIKEVVEFKRGELNRVVGDEQLSKSKKVQRLFEAGMGIKEIANTIGIRYNFAYNVISNLVVQGKIEVIEIDKGSKKDLVIGLHKEGKTNKEIAMELKTNYNYVYKIVKEYKASEAETKTVAEVM